MTKASLKADGLAGLLTLAPIVTGGTVADTTREATASLGNAPSTLLAVLALIVTVTVMHEALRHQYMPLLALLEAEAQTEATQ
jgi:hypothetical protein